MQIDNGCAAFTVTNFHLEVSNLECLFFIYKSGFVG